jgi:PTS system nitrogen regulatory IIA component
VPYRNLSLEEFARHVGMDEREVRKLAERGRLPGQKIGGQWRFNRAKVTEWMQQEMHLLDERRLIEVEQVMGDGYGMVDGDTVPVVTDLIGLEGIDLALPARTAKSVLRELVNLAEGTGLLYDPEGLLNALEEREGMCSTALPGKVAIPHPRQPLPYVSAEPMICLGRVPAGIGFGAPDGKLTQIFFMICCHDDRHHLHVLARLMRILDADTLEEILHSESREELLQFLIDREAQVVARKESTR